MAPGGESTIRKPIIECELIIDKVLREDNVSMMAAGVAVDKHAAPHGEGYERIDISRTHSGVRTGRHSGLQRRVFKFGEGNTARREIYIGPEKEQQTEEDGCVQKEDVGVDKERRRELNTVPVGWRLVVLVNRHLFATVRRNPNRKYKMEGCFLVPMRRAKGINPKDRKSPMGSQAPLTEAPKEPSSELTLLVTNSLRK